MRPTSILLAGLLLVTAAATVGFAVRVPCLHCLGEGLTQEPPGGAWKTRWIRARDLFPVECPSCSDRLKVSLFRKWKGGSEQPPEPPIYRAKHGEAFTEIRRARIGDLRDLAVRFTGQEHPPSHASTRPDLLPVLTAALNDEDGKVRSHAMLAVAEMNHEKALPVLLGALNHEDSNVQSRACMGLGWLGRSPSLREEIVSSLMKVYDSGEEAEPDVRLAAASALFELGALPSAEVFIEALKEDRVSWNLARRVFVQFQRKEFTFALIKKMATVPPTMTAEYGADLERLTGETFGEDPVRWYRWFEKNRDAFPAQKE